MSVCLRSGPYGLYLEFDSHSEALVLTPLGAPVGGLLGTGGPAWTGGEDLRDSVAIRLPPRNNDDDDDCDDDDAGSEWRPMPTPTTPTGPTPAVPVPAGASATGATALPATGATALPATGATTATAATTPLLAHWDSAGALCVDALIEVACNGMFGCGRVGQEWSDHGPAPDDRDSAFRVARCRLVLVSHAAVSLTASLGALAMIANANDGGHGCTLAP
jgi:hypothetical protein